MWRYHLEPRAVEAEHLKDGAVLPEKLSFSTWEKLAEVTLESNLDYVEFTGLDIKKDGVYMLYSNVYNPTASAEDIYIFVERDYTTTNYYTQVLVADGTAVSANRHNFPTVLGVSAGDRGVSSTIIWRRADGMFVAHVDDIRFAGSAVRFELKHVSKATAVDNITSLRLQASVAGGLGAGSRFILCRVRTR